MTHLLDSNICVDVLRGRSEVVGRLARLSPDDCAVSSITAFELLAGARKSSDPVREAARVRHLLDMLVLVEFGDAAADRAASVRVELECQGMKIGAYDTLIAGHALALGLICATNNTTEFSRVAGLEVQAWRS